MKLMRATANVATCKKLKVACDMGGLMCYKYKQEDTSDVLFRAQREKRTKWT